MAKNFRTLYSRLPAAARDEVEAKVKESLEEFTLAELRAAMDITQVELARKLHTDQASISKLERRADMLLSTLESTISGMGGSLSLVVNLPSGEIRTISLRGHKSGRKKRKPSAAAIGPRRAVSA